MQTQDKVLGLHNCQEFSQLLKCLYQAMQIQEKVFYCFYKLRNFPEKKIVMALIKREILPICEVCVISSCFAKRGF